MQKQMRNRRDHGVLGRIIPSFRLGIKLRPYNA